MKVDFNTKNDLHIIINYKNTTKYHPCIYKNEYLLSVKYLYFLQLYHITFFINHNLLSSVCHPIFAIYGSNLNINIFHGVFYHHASGTMSMYDKFFNRNVVWNIVICQEF